MSDYPPPPPPPPPLPPGLGNYRERQYSYNDDEDMLPPPPPDFSNIPYAEDDSQYLPPPPPPPPSHGNRMSEYHDRYSKTSNSFPPPPDQQFSNSRSLSPSEEYDGSYDRYHGHSKYTTYPIIDDTHDNFDTLALGIRNSITQSPDQNHRTSFNPKGGISSIPPLVSYHGRQSSSDRSLSGSDRNLISGNHSQGTGRQSEEYSDYWNLPDNSRRLSIVDDSNDYQYLSHDYLGSTTSCKLHAD